MLEPKPTSHRRRCNYSFTTTISHDGFPCLCAPLLYHLCCAAVLLQFIQLCVCVLSLYQWPPIVFCVLTIKTIRVLLAKQFPISFISFQQSSHAVLKQNQFRSFPHSPVFVISSSSPMCCCRQVLSRRSSSIAPPHMFFPLCRYVQ